MREGIGSIALYNIIIIFIAVTFSVLAGTMSYSKAFKVNNRIINAIEKYEGYNELAAIEINTKLMDIGYKLGEGSCNKRRGYSPMEDLNPDYNFCVYQYPEETREWNGRYSTYGVLTYIKKSLYVQLKDEYVDTYSNPETGKLRFYENELNYVAIKEIFNVYVYSEDGIYTPVSEFDYYYSFDTREKALTFSWGDLYSTLFYDLVAREQ